MASKNMFLDFAAMVESLTQEVGSEGEQFLLPPRDNLEQWKTSLGSFSVSEAVQKVRHG
jgi:hypothetical protein